VSATRTGVYPGSFDPLTIAHLAIADAARDHARLDRLDLALSTVTLAKEHLDRESVERRARDIRATTRDRSWLDVVVTDAQLIADIATGYDVVVMGADKWAQVRDPHWYADDPVARDAALASLPRVLVAPRPGFDGSGAEALDIDPVFADVSSTRARAGEHHLVAVPPPRRLVVDGNNVFGSRPDGWWRDREGAARSLVSELQSLAAVTGDRITVVFDGRPLGGLEEGDHGGVVVLYARRPGRDAGDDRIVETVSADADPEALVVVTSDRELARRVRALGARVEGARSVSRDRGTEPR
jgi:predicted RNA-binding protein with PIN domain/nicotinic acid mononucleotide adenylyltransferase